MAVAIVALPGRDLALYPSPPTANAVQKLEAIRSSGGSG